MDQKIDKPLVSIACLTFNHESFLSDAIESFLIQKCNFNYEIVIGDGGSTDSNRLIIENYKKKNPEQIITVLPTKDPGIFQTLELIISECQGKYIAFCEGDDYWIDENKLQKQVDFLENHSDYSLCFHKTHILQDGIIQDIQTPVPANPDIYSLAEINYIYTPSCLYKSETIKSIPKQFLKHGIGDYFLHMMAASKGKIKYLDAPMAIYRIHQGGIWTKSDKVKRLLVFGNVLIELFNYFTDKRLKDVLALKIAEHFYEIGKTYHDNKDIQLAEENYRIALKFSGSLLKLIEWHAVSQSIHLEKKLLFTSEITKRFTFFQLLKAIVKKVI
jgi:glycosyltransferase involved in cell wall biosynthesis